MDKKCEEMYQKLILLLYTKEIQEFLKTLIEIMKEAAEK